MYKIVVMYEECVALSGVDGSPAAVLRKQVTFLFGAAKRLFNLLFIFRIRWEE